MLKTGPNKRPKILEPEPQVKEVPSIATESMSSENLSQELATKLSPSVISLASFAGDKLHYRCTGIVIEEHPFGPSILTTSNLLTATDGARKVIRPTLRIKLHLSNNEVVNGWLKHLNWSCKMAVITTSFFPDLRAACLTNRMQVDSHTKLLAVERCFNSGELMATNGVLIDCPSGDGCEGFMLSTCQITKDGSGGPLIDFDGNIVGMNEYLGSDMARYIPTNKILEYLRSIVLCKNKGVLRPLRSRVGPSELCRMTMQNKGVSRLHSTLHPKVKSGHGTSGSDEQKELDEPQAPECIGDEPAVNKYLTSVGYPLPKYADDGMHLRGDFEEEFSTDIWRKKTRRRITSMTCRSVVALASFNEKGRYFACTGVLIECNQSIRVLTSANLVRKGNKIEENLRIEVLLPNKKRPAGTLQYYSLQYNVAVVSIIDFHGNRAAKFVEEPQTKVVALGRVFKSGNFMTTMGVVTGKQSRFDCKELKVSSCKITKAGIGGPLIDFNGNIVGINFYDMEETPYLPSNMIRKLLRHFELKRTVAAWITEEDPCNRKLFNDNWPVPDPYWYYPSLHHRRNDAPAVWCFD